MNIEIRQGDSPYTEAKPDKRNAYEQGFVNGEQARKKYGAVAIGNFVKRMSHKRDGYTKGFVDGLMGKRRA